jgi:hypothetical protein
MTATLFLRLPEVEPGAALASEPVAADSGNGVAASDTCPQARPGGVHGLVLTHLRRGLSRPASSSIDSAL